MARVLLAKDISLAMRGKVYDACVRSCMLYGGETWPMKKEDELRLERNDRRMIRWMVGVKLSDRVSSEELRRKLNLEEIGVVLRRRRLRWFGHVERKDEKDWVKMCSHLEVDGKRPKGRPRKTWLETIQSDMRVVGLKAQDPLDRVNGERVYGGEAHQVAANPG